MSSTYVTSFFADNVFFYTGDTNPNGVLSAPRGSWLVRTDAGNVRTYLNTDGATAWSYSPSIDPNGDLNLTGVDQITLLDNAAVALEIGSTGLLNLLRFVTTNGAEAMQYRGALPFEIVTGGLAVTAGTVSLPQASLNVASATTDAADGAVTAGLFLRKTHGAGASTTDVVLPARVGGWRVVDAYITSGGAAAGSVQLQTAGGANNISNSMVPGGNLGAITRANLIDPTFSTIASGGTIRLNVAAGALAGEAFIRIEPL